MKLIRTRHAAAALAAAFTFTLALASPARAADDPLALVPEQAHIVVVVNDLRGISDRLAELRQTLNIPADEMGDLLGRIKGELNIEEGLDEAGSLVIVLPDLTPQFENPKQAENPDALILVPVTDYKKFVESFDVEAAQGVTALDVDAFARQHGKYAVIGQKQALVEAYQPAAAKPADRWSAFITDRAAKADASVIVDVQAMAPALRPMLKEAMVEAKAEMKREMGAMAGGGMADPEAMVDLMEKVLIAGLDDTEAAIATAALDDKGAALDFALKLKEGSDTAKYFPGGGGGSSDILSRLPAGAYVMAMSADMKAMAADKMMAAFADAMPEQAGAMMALYTQAAPLMKEMEQYAAALYAPGEGGGFGGIMNAVTVVKATNPEAFVKAQADYIKGLNEFKLPAGLPAEGDGDPPAITYLTVYQEDVMQVDGVSVDQFQVSMQFPPEMAQLAPMLNMLGGAAYSGYVGRQGDYIVTTTALDAGLLKKGLAAAKADTGLGAGDAHALVRERGVVDQPVMEMYISFGGVARMVNPFLMMMPVPAGDGPVQLNIPADAPPLAMSLGRADQGIAGRLFIPMDTAKAVGDEVRRLSEQFGEGVGPAPGPAPDAGPRDNGDGPPRPPIS